VSLEQDITDLERQWMNAFLQQDRATCDRLLADDFLITSARGSVHGKDQWLKNAMGDFVGEKFYWDDIRVRSLARDVVLVHARVSQTASVAGQDWSGTFLLSDLWVQRDGRWQVVARHGTGPLPQ
jgi:hypothetical protein